MRRFGITVSMIAALSTVACNPFVRRRKPKVPPVIAAPAPAPKPLPKPVPIDAPDPPKIDQPTLSSIPPPPGQPGPPTDSPAPEPEPMSKPVAPRTTEPAKVGPVAVPQLAQLLTDEQRAQYEQEVEEFLGRVGASLGKLSGRTLTEQQRMARDRVRALAQQSREIREADLTTARALAERADLLALDLERSSR
ncbi:MAG: hypothetical protein GY953_16325 [bacterium]|nr:hypothetical protein [bacterium]